MDTRTQQQEAAVRAVAVLGGPVSAARVLKVKDERYQTVQSWLANRVPAEYCPVIERETRERGAVVTCEELRPDVPWSVLRQTTETADITYDGPERRKGEASRRREAA